MDTAGCITGLRGCVGFTQQGFGRWVGCRGRLSCIETGGCPLVRQLIARSVAYTEFKRVQNYSAVGGHTLLNVAVVAIYTLQCCHREDDIYHCCSVLVFPQCSECSSVLGFIQCIACS